MFGSDKANIVETKVEGVEQSSVKVQTVNHSTAENVVCAEQVSDSFNTYNYTTTHNYYSEKEQKEVQVLVNIHHLPEPTTALIGRKTELAQLTEAIKNPHKRLAIIVAAGGIGKSALTDEWLQQIAQENYYGKTRVFGWSFYAQGTHTTYANSQEFFNEALSFLGVTQIPKEEDKKARLLFDELQKQPCLLILDGLEPLQYSKNLQSMNGELQDSTLKEFIVQFRQRAGKSFVLFSSRQPLVELKKWQAEHFLELPLETLPHDDGAELLSKLGVTGNEEERQAISKDLNGHALSLVLMGHLLREHHQGDCRYANELPPLTSAHGDSDAEKDSRHALRVLDYYDSLQDAASRCFLQLLGLFDRPMKVDEKNALLKGDFSHIPSKNIIKRLFGISQPDFLTPLRKLNADEWKKLERYLEKNSLLFGKKGSFGYIELDTHPIIRNYFGQKFKKDNREAFKQAHRVLFNYYQNLPEKEFPDTLDEMQPLYLAVRHGCLAEEYVKALHDVYISRILRRKDNGWIEHYSWYQLGAYSQDLTALASFFPSGWETPELKQGLMMIAAQRFLLVEISFCLMSLGRLRVAIRPRIISLWTSKKSRLWFEAAENAPVLVELYLALGKLSKAHTQAEQSIEYAQNSKVIYQQVATQSYLATVLYCQGNFIEALKNFQHAEVLQVTQDIISQQYLSSLNGFSYCRFLLDTTIDKTALQEIITRAKYSLELLKKLNHLLSISWDYLTIARAYFILNELTQAESYFEQAIQEVKKANQIVYVSLFYLYRADFYLTQNQLDPTLADLNSAWEIIERCDMKLYQVDYDLIFGRYCLEINNFDTAKIHYQEAKQLIEKTGYHLRDAELDLFAAQICQRTNQDFHSKTVDDYLRKAKNRIEEIGQWGLMRVIKRDFPTEYKQLF